MITQQHENEKQPGESQAPSTDEEELMESSFEEKRSGKMPLYGAWKQFLAGGWKTLLAGLLVGIALFAVGRWWLAPIFMAAFSGQQPGFVWLGLLIAFVGGVAGGMAMRSGWALLFVCVPLYVGLWLVGGELFALVFGLIPIAIAFIGAATGIRIGKWLEKRLTK